MGYVPFILNGNIHVSYVATYSCKKKDGNLEFILRVSSLIFDYKSNAFITNIIKFILNKLFFFMKTNDFKNQWLFGAFFCGAAVGGSLCR